MFELKTYQKRCLEELAQFFRQTNKLGAAKLAFYEQTNRRYQDVADLPGLPYVCVRVPTGGGKTVMASHAVGLGAKELLLAEQCLVLWLAPTTQIVSQTIQALQDKRDPYRQALDQAFGGCVSVLDMPSALSIKPGLLSADTVVIVSTIQAPRVGEKEGRKIYAEDNGQLMDHFENLTPEQLMLVDKLESGKPARSLANVFKLHRPVIIVDEAHNARTPLSFETLARFNPSCILEFTATPADDSNVLTHASAAELKAEEMIKLPVRLRTRPQWKEAVQEALFMQAELEKAATEEQEATGEYIRPIVLLQAQRKGTGNITFDVLKQSLLDDFDVPEDQVLIATGKKNELDGVDVLDANSPVRFIITVDKLREGWDCAFAYVLCSVSNLTSPTAVEQIMGRILRMPHARRKKNGALNHAYAYVTSQGFVDAANTLTEALIDSGFNPYEAKQSIKPAEQFDLPLDLPLFGPVTEVVSTAPDVERIPTLLKEHVQLLSAKETGVTVIRYAGPAIPKGEEREWKSAFDNDGDKKAIERLARKSRGEDAWAAAMGEKLSVPVLAVREDGRLALFEDQFREALWKLSECDTLLSEAEFSIPTGSQTGADIDVEDGKLGWSSFTETLHRQLSLLDLHGPKTEIDLSVWLDRAIDHPDITQVEASLYMRKLIDDLETKRGIGLEQLLAQRFRLRDAVRDKIRSLRQTCEKKAFEQMLLPGRRVPLEANAELCFTFPLNQYPARTLYAGPFKPNKHYYEIPAAMNAEEADCAALLDSLPEVDFWVRNLDRDQFAFWLQTSTDKFYPDFVAKLKDGRFFVVEYKGSHLLNEDTTEKERLGQLWEARSNGLCLFRLVTKANMNAEIPSAIRGGP